MHTMVCCRLDLAYAMSVISRFMTNPGQPHGVATTWVLRSLCGTTGMGLKYVSQGGVQKIEGFVDLDFPRSIDTRRSWEHNQLES